jgi:hypothetical protein
VNGANSESATTTTRPGFVITDRATAMVCKASSERSWVRLRRCRR